FNSDFTGTDWSLFYGIHAATTRTQKDGSPEGGWIAEEALTAEEALRAYTVWPARAAQQEDRTGTISTGKWADLTVLSLDPLNTPSPALLQGSALMTMVAGEIRWTAPDYQP
ncbi:MAG: amidohydrolase family protein, partial [Bacteroidetes bacterium]|nr:amidohydrolase family protein [Bacteroidota bacterium]